MAGLPNGAYAGGTAGLATAWNTGSAGLNFLNSMNLGNADLGAIGGADADGGAVRNAEDIVPGGAFNADPLDYFVVDFPPGTGIDSSANITLQVGANENDKLDLSLVAASLGRLQLDEVNLASDPERAIILADSALSEISMAQANLGAVMNRLESGARAAAAVNEATSAARGRIMDADFGAAAAEQSKSLILQNAAASMLAQANVAPRQALQLLAA